MNTIERLDRLSKHYGGEGFCVPCGAGAHALLNKLDRQAAIRTTGGYKTVVLHYGSPYKNTVGERIRLHEKHIALDLYYFWLGEQAENI